MDSIALAPLGLQDDILESVSSPGPTMRVVSDRQIVYTDIMDALSGSAVKRAAGYWLKTSAHDYDTMRALYKSRRYSDCLFFGHLVLEKVLKARAVIEMGAHPPYTHNLSHLAQLARVKLSQEETALLAQVNEFNLQTRYPDERLEFYKFATKKYTDHYYMPIQKLYHRLCQLVPQK